MFKKVPLLIIAGFALTGCSTKLDVGRISDPTTVADTSNFKGIPFREYRSHIVHLYVLDESDNTFKKVSVSDEVIASPDAVYYLSSSSKWLADSTLTAKPRSDGTLSTVTLSSENKTLGTIDTAIEEFNKLQDAEEARDKTEQANALACVEAEVALNIAEETLNALPEDTTVLDRTRAEGDVLIADIKKRNACLEE